MKEIKRHNINENWAYSGIVEAGDFAFVNYCAGNVGQGIEEQVNGALDDLENNLSFAHLDLSSVVKLTALFRDIRDIEVMEKVFKERFRGTYPARTSIQTTFDDHGNGLLFQLDAIAYKGNKDNEK